MEDDLETLQLRAMAKAKAAKAQSYPEEEKTMGDYAKSLGSGVLTTLGAAGSAVRSGIAHATGLSKPEDTIFNAPSTDELLNRAGVGNIALSDVTPSMYAEPGEGGMFTPEKGGMLDLTARGTAGFVGDVALDPMTYLSGGLSAAAKLGKAAPAAELLTRLGQMNEAGKLTGVAKAANYALNPAEILSRSGGRSIYNTAFDKADRKIATDAGIGSIADLLFENNFTGNSQQALDELKNIHSSTGEKLRKMREKASGTTGSLQEHMSPQFSSNIEGLTTKLRVSPEAAHQAEAQAIEDLVAGYASKGQLTPQELSDLKRLVNPKVSQMSKAIRPVSKDQEDIARALLGGELNKTENQVMHSALGDDGVAEYLKAKKDYGTSGYSVQKEIDKQAAREMNLTGGKVSSLDPLIAAKMGFLPYLGKKAVDISKLTGTKTRVGKGLHSIGTNANGLMDAAARQNVWKQVNKGASNEDAQ
jgi:hypothetical protein